MSGLLSPHSRELGLPAKLADGIARNADRVALRSLAQAGVLREVHCRLAAAGIPALFVKGLAVEALTGRPLGDRGSGDIDVWVAPDRVAGALAALGPDWRLPTEFPQPGPSWSWRHWQRWGSELPLVGPTTVDLHWHLHGVRADLPDFAEAWRARQKVFVGAHAVPTLGPAHALAHACRHAQTDRWRALHSLVDIHLLLAGGGRSRVSDAPIEVTGPTFGIVDRAIGLPPGWVARASTTRQWATAFDEQRRLGTHAERIAQLSRPVYLRRVATRFTPTGRHPVHDALSLLWFVAVAPPQESGGITTTSTTLGVCQAVTRRIRYERERADGDRRVGARGPTEGEVRPAGDDPPPPSPIRRQAPPPVSRR